MARPDLKLGSEHHASLERRNRPASRDQESVEPGTVNRSPMEPGELVARPTPPNRRKDGGREAEMLKRIAVSVGALALVGFMALPAFAAPSDKDGDADSFESTHYTEDTDTNDGADANVDETTDNMHPSKKDRSVEGGRSGTQGKAESNPDDTNGPRRYEGTIDEADKAQGLGGEDLADQDGNNGCGNDDDFDDDSNGRCGGPTAGGSTDIPPTEILPIKGSKTLVLASKGSTEVLGVNFSRSPKPTAVLGVQFQRGHALARTGTDVTPALLLLGMTLVAGGLGALKIAKRSV